MNRKEGLEFLQDKDYEKNPFKFGNGFSIPWKIMDEEIPIIEKVILSMVISYTSNDREFYMSNSYLAGMLQVCIKTISKSVKSLHDAGFIRMYFKYARYDPTPKGRTLEPIGKYRVDVEHEAGYIYKEYEFNIKDI
jgi:hypothetical protein